MRDQFPAYYPPTDDEIDEVWEKGLIVLDANVLLHFFRWPEHLRQEYEALLENRSERLWLPHQVALEFQRGRASVSATTAARVEAARKSILGAVEKLTGTLDNYKTHPTLDHGAIGEVLERMEAELGDLFDAAEQKVSNAPTADPDDPVLQLIERLYDGRIGSAFDDKTLPEQRKEAKRRRDNKIPPGYMDRPKTDDDTPGDPDGDYLLWAQILDHAGSLKVPVLFVTDDGKEDWWRTTKRGEKLGPRPELIDEFHAATGKRLHMASPAHFLDHGRKYVDEIDEESVELSQSFSEQWVGDVGRALVAPAAAQLFDISNILASMPKIELDRLMMRNLPLFTDSIDWNLISSIVTENNAEISRRLAIAASLDDAVRHQRNAAQDDPDEDSTDDPADDSEAAPEYNDDES